MSRVFLELVEFGVELPDGTKVPLGFEVHRAEKGWAVAVPDAQSFTGEDGLKKAMAIATETTRAVGGFFDGTEAFFDVIWIFEDEDEATKAGKETGQLFIIEIESQRIKWID